MISHNLKLTLALATFTRINAISYENYGDYDDYDDDIELGYEETYEYGYMRGYYRGYNEAITQDYEADDDILRIEEVIMDTNCIEIYEALSFEEFPPDSEEFLQLWHGHLKSMDGIDYDSDEEEAYLSM